MKAPNRQFTSLALSIWAALCAPAVLAGPIVVVPYSLFSSSFSFDGALVDSEQNSDTTSGVSASSALSTPTGRTNGSTFANPSGAYAVSTYSTGGVVGQPTASEALSNLTFLLSNNTSSAQNFSLTLKIYGGSMSTQLNDPAGLTGQEFMRTGYEAKVTRANDTANPLFASAAWLERTASSLGFGRSGTTLTGAPSISDAALLQSYSWNTDFYTIDLGTVAAGGFMQIDASLYGFSRSALGLYGSCGSAETDSPTLQQANSEGSACFNGEARQFYGDPLGGQGLGTFSFSAQTVANNVPEPGSLLLAGAALGAAGLSRRRSKAAIPQ